MTTHALIIADLDRTPLGVPASLDAVLAGDTVLSHTARRAARIKGVSRIVVVHPPGQDPLPLIDTDAVGLPVLAVASAEMTAEADVYRQHRIAARAWSLTAWRGGLGGAMAYDELLPARALRDALNAHPADAAVLVGGAWCLFDPEPVSEQLARHVGAPEAMKITFTQSPPGLGALVVGREMIDKLAEGRGELGRALVYNPNRPQVDPIGREVNVGIDASVRNCARRFTHEFDRDRDRLSALADRLGDRGFAEADALTIARTTHAVEAEHPDHLLDRLPQQCVVELTPRRTVAGPITPQGHVALDRPDLDPDHAARLFAQLPDDAAVLLGGLGDALEHPQWDAIARAAKDAGAIAVGIETDLRCDRAELQKILDTPVDVVCVRLNADSPETYQKVMGDDQFMDVIDNAQWLLNQRQARTRAIFELEGETDGGTSGAASGGGGNFRGAGLPWVIPRLVKTPDTLRDMEGFFDRWVRIVGHAVIDPAPTGCGLMEDRSPVPMTPPRRTPCRQLGRRLSILSDGTLAQCDQDWLGRAPLGDTRTHTLLDLWQNLQPTCSAHREGRFQELTLCGDCTSWYRP